MYDVPEMTNEANNQTEERTMTGTNKKNGKRYMILKNISGEYDHETSEYVSGISLDDEGRTRGPIRMLRTANLRIT